MIPTSTTRPWGSFIRFTENEPSTVKLLYVTKGEELSLQYHTHREEFWRVIEGSPEIIIGDETFHPTVGEEFFIKSGVQHRISAPTDNIVILEIATGQFDENDIVRMEDKYNRMS
ncbi:MAG: phosphomannose isomerase type II C-terminal cupin domain [Patescibacteria group bacterium]